MKTFAILWLSLLASFALGTEAKVLEVRLDVTVVTYAKADPRDEKNRLLIMGQTAFRTFNEFKEAIHDLAKHRGTQYEVVLHRSDVIWAPDLERKELKELKDFCDQLGIRFRVSYRG